MRRTWQIALVIGLLLALSLFFLFSCENTKTFTAMPGEVVELSFELDKRFEFGEYYFDLDNGKGATYPLCYCLKEKNMYPPDCLGDIKYIYNNTPGTMCIPLYIGKGSCSSKVMNTSGYSTVFLIPLEYQWTKPVEKIVIGISVPEQAPEAARMVIAVTVFKKNDLGKLMVYRKYEQVIVVDRK
jgi:hypothetical protein